MSQTTAEVSEEFQQWKNEYRTETSKKKLWDQIGFHRPLGGFWHNFILQLFIIIVPSLWAAYLLKFLYPYPEMRGYRQTIQNIFVLIFAIFDLGTSSTISRFIADENIKNPGKMVQYVQYFIWYQMITGLIQVTALSIWVLTSLNQGFLAYGSWITLIIIIKQYPGFPGVFKGIMNSLQMYSKKNLLDFFQGEAIQVVTEIAFVVIGRQWGLSNPAVGEILGVAIGATFGLYLDDIIATFIGAYILAKELKPYGITFKRFFLVEFDWHLVKRCAFFGVRIGAPGLLGAVVQLTSLMLCIQYIPQYTTFVALSSIATMLVATAERLVQQKFESIFVEAYQNGGKKLCQYYNAHAFRFFLVNSGFAASVMLMVISVFPTLLNGIGLESYLLAIPFLIPALIVRLFKPYRNYPGGILLAGHKPNIIMGLSLARDACKLLAWYLTVAVFQVQDLGMLGLVYVLIATEFPVEVLFFLIKMIIIHKSIFKIKLMIWQTFIAPSLATIILFGGFTLFKIFMFDWLFTVNFWLAVALGLVFIFGLVLFGYFPLTVFLGGWDENSIADMKKAVKMAGASKIIVVPATFLIFKAAKRAKLHNRFKYDENEAYKEIREIMRIRNQNREHQLDIEIESA